MNATKRALIGCEAASIAALAASALHLAVQGMRATCEHSEPGASMVNGLEWLATYTRDMAEAARALANEDPPGWKVLLDEADIHAACAAIPPDESTAAGEQ